MKDVPKYVQYIKSQIITEVRNAVIFSLTVDLTKDISKKEQLSIVVRYVHDIIILEAFMCFTVAEALDAISYLLPSNARLLGAMLTSMDAEHNAVTALLSCPEKTTVYRNCFDK